MNSTVATKWQLPKFVCPRCTCDMSKVIEGRPVTMNPTQDHEGYRRRRQCAKCHHRFTTLERIWRSK